MPAFPVNGQSEAIDFRIRLILAGLYTSKIEKTAATIMQHISAFEKSLKDVSRDLNTLITHINNSKNAGDRIINKVQQLEGKLDDLLHLENEQPRA